MAQLADASPGEPYEATPLTVDQAIAFIQALQGNRWRALYVLTLMQALRQSEVVGLRWSDIDLPGRTIHVRGQLARVAGQVQHIPRAKTRGSRQPLVLVEYAAEAIQERRRIQLEERLLAGSRWQGDDWVFTSRHGAATSQRAADREFKRVLQVAGLPDTRFHDLRHTTGALLQSIGVPLNIIKVILRHSTLAMTADVYTHTYRAELEDAARRLDDLLRRRPG